MGLTTSLANAFSGLTVTSKAAQLVSSNLANAMNENYARQEMEIFHRNGGGVRASQAERFVDEALVSERRKVSAELSLANETLQAAREFEGAFGAADNPSSVAAMLTNFDSALRYLESDPGSSVRLKDSINSANALVDRLSVAEEKIQVQRSRAEQQIASEIGSLNLNLEHIVSLNEKIVSANVNGRNPNALLDQRQELIDQVGELVPLRILHTNNGSISLMTANGQLLTDTNAARFDFTKSNLIMPHMTIESGDLSTLMFGEEPIDMSSNSGPLAGGRLQGLFMVRDNNAPYAQQQLDELAFDLASRFQDLPMDPSASVALPGLFTDNGERVDDVNRVGLAGRLSLNDSVDPEQGGQLWKLQSGLYSPIKSPAGDANLITGMISALNLPNSAHGTAFNHVAALSSDFALRLSTLEQDHSFANSKFDQLHQMHLSNGVDTDAELQKLLVIENNYAANAQVMKTVEEMFDTIMRIN